MIETIEILLSYKNLSVNEIFSCLSKNNSLYLLDFIRKINSNISNDLYHYILSDENKKTIMSCKYISVTDKENIISFLEVFGKSDLNGQIINCKTYKDVFKKTLKKLEKTESADCKNMGTIILGTGLLLIILLL